MRIFINGLYHNILLAMAREVEIDPLFHQAMEIMRRIERIHRETREMMQGWGKRSR